MKCALFDLVSTRTQELKRHAGDEQQEEGLGVCGKSLSKMPTSRQTSGSDNNQVSVRF